MRNSREVNSKNNNNQPLFPRVHVSDTRNGPKAPPRNKMALYEQLTIPSQHFVQDQSTWPPPVNLAAYQYPNTNAYSSFVVPSSDRQAARASNSAGTSQHQHNQQLQQRYVSQQRDHGEFQRVPFLTSSAYVAKSNERELASRDVSHKRARHANAAVNVPRQQQKQQRGQQRRQQQRSEPRRQIEPISSSTRDESNQEDYYTSGGVSDESIVQESDGKIAATDIISAVGESEFWRIRKNLIRQQRIFASHVFELHRLTQVQHLLADSPSILYESDNAIPESIQQPGQQQQRTVEPKKKNVEVVQHKVQERREQQNTQGTYSHQHTPGHTQAPVYGYTYPSRYTGNLQCLPYPYIGFQPPPPPPPPTMVPANYQPMFAPYGYENMYHVDAQGHGQVHGQAQKMVMYYPQQFQPHWPSQPQAFYSPWYSPYPSPPNVSANSMAISQEKRPYPKATASTSELTSEKMSYNQCLEPDDNAKGGTITPFSYLSPTERLSSVVRSKPAPRAVMATPESAADILKRIQRER